MNVNRDAELNVLVGDSVNVRVVHACQRVAVRRERKTERKITLV